jgi:hypothetical protein
MVPKPPSYIISADIGDLFSVLHQSAPVEQGHRLPQHAEAALVPGL